LFFELDQQMDLEGHMWLFSFPQKMPVPIGKDFVILPGRRSAGAMCAPYLISTGAIRWR